MEKVKPTEIHQHFSNDIKELLGKHKDKLSAMEMLALASHLVGALVALQDQRAHTPDAVMKLVRDNIEVGNKEVIDNLADFEGVVQ